MDQLNQIFRKIDQQKSTKRLFEQFNNKNDDDGGTEILLEKGCSASIVYYCHMNTTSWNNYKRSYGYGHSYGGHQQRHRIESTPNLANQRRYYRDWEASAILSQPIMAKLRFKSAEVCARIIGRNGLLVREIRQRTDTVVESPKIIDNQSTKTFEIEGETVRGVLAAAVAIQQLGLYFDRQINELSCPVQKDEIRLDVDCDPRIVSCVLAGRGRHVIEVAKQTSVRIISPKPYSNRCCFKLIGLPLNVILACLKLRRLINDIGKKYDNKMSKQLCSGPAPVPVLATSTSPTITDGSDQNQTELTKPNSPTIYTKYFFRRNSPDNSFSI